jgi:hypothetical protein
VRTGVEEISTFAAMLTQAGKMPIPLVLRIFPSVIMVILGPAAIQMIRTMMPLLQGQ